ncbi:MAG: PIN domain-containing protein [Stenomitos rutilans HA7619-LM2]|jgi:predicted nucleic acid-binding protein|nr:PIN domain-containing protein [Stenomitos rutilans HA7619-LM2]
MTTIFADTGYWIALLDPQDNLHQKAASLTAALTAKIVTSEMVFTEVLNAFSKRGNFLKQSAVTLIRGSVRNPNVVVVPQTSDLFQAAFDLYSQRLDQSWSHTDCASFCIMQQQNIQEALAYDRHFEQAGFIALLR